MDLVQAMDFLEQNQQKILDLTIKLAEINSGSLNVSGLNAVANILQEQMSDLQSEHVSMPVAPLQHVNEHGDITELPLADVQRFWKRPKAPFQVLMVGHTDTVFSPQHKFQQIKKVGGDILHGPGVADMKGGLAVIIWALKAFEQLPCANNLGWELLLNADEEIGSPGSAEIIAYRAKQHNVGFVFEPALDEQGTLSGARKGSGNYTFVMRGKSAHAGRHFHEGRNAICKMAEVIMQLHALNGVRDGVIINVGSVHGGEAVNVVPDYCVCKINVRILDIEDVAWVETEINKIMQAMQHLEGYKLELYGGFSRMPKKMDSATEQLYKIVGDVGLKLDQKISWQLSGGSSDGNNLSAVGLPNVDSLGVRGGKMHTNQEFLLVPSLLERAKLLLNVLVYLSENGFKDGN